MDEVGPLAVGAGVGLAGYGAYKGLKAIQNAQAPGIERRAQRSAMAYGGDTERPFNFGDKKKKIKAAADAKLAADASESSTWNYRKSVGAAFVFNNLSEKV